MRSVLKMPGGCIYIMEVEGSFDVLLSFVTEAHECTGGALQ